MRRLRDQVFKEKVRICARWKVCEEKRLEEISFQKNIVQEYDRQKAVQIS
ncbi:MAG: hypothetical protein RXQ98_09175 [Sulfolobaceae archaeon]